ncbi:hypothetical protein [Paraclostridium benzoelyticum]|uniref:hypothetical protein n=1 Tax=Paraclostridium benzoelyticum TaxID=1629550 RepID=UPI000A86A288|nr:hypothetical protein [Paraclostridium benzoelyticum]
MNFKIKKNYIIVFASALVLLIFIAKLNNLNNFKKEEKIKIQNVKILIQNGNYDVAEKN